MDDNLVRFLTGSPMAGKIKLPAMVVIQRTEMSSRDVMTVKQSGAYGPIPKQDETCELHIGGQRIALGRIVRRKGEYYFKVGRIEAGEDAKEATK